jgi:hypothetical protein
MSEATKHTEGEWRFTGEHDGFVITDDGTRVCQTFSKLEVDFPNAQANGPLLAASKKLLAACKSAVADIEGPDVITEATYDQLRAAIAAARGTNQ